MESAIAKAIGLPLHPVALLFSDEMPEGAMQFAERPRAVVGLTDPSARLYISTLVGHGLMTFAVPFALYSRMEADVPGSFLERDTWRALMAEKARAARQEPAAS